MRSPDFEAMVGGLPADEAAASAQLRADLAAQGSSIANTSPFSPFFLLLAAVFSGPVLTLRELVVGTILPGLFAQTATGALLDLHAAGMDEARLPATRARGSLTFTREGTTGALPIPAGTIVESPAIDGVVYRLVTDAAAEIPAGVASALVQATAEQAGQAYNLGDGYYSILPVAVPGVTAVANEADWLESPGADTETDAALRERLRLKWKRLSGWYTADTYRFLIAEATGIDPLLIHFDLTAPRGAGSADAYFYTEAGIPSPALVAQADAYINAEGRHGLGDDLVVKAMPALPVAVDVTVTADAEAIQAEQEQLQSDVATLLRAAFRESTAYPDVPRTAPFERVSRSALAGHVHAEFPLAVAVDWTAPATDPEPGLELPVLQRATLDAGPAVDQGGGLVGLPATAHGLAAGTRIVVAGTAGYDGTHTVDAATTADEIVIAAAYAAENFTGAETAEALVVTVI